MCSVRTGRSVHHAPQWCSRLRLLHTGNLSFDGSAHSLSVRGSLPPLHPQSTRMGYGKGRKGAPPGPTLKEAGSEYAQQSTAVSHQSYRRGHTYVERSHPTTTFLTARAHNFFFCNHPLASVPFMHSPPPPPWVVLEGGGGQGSPPPLCPVSFFPRPMWWRGTARSWERPPVKHAGAGVGDARGQQHHLWAEG